MKLKLCWMEGRNERCSESDLPLTTIEETTASFHLSLKKALKFSTELIPHGLLQNGEVL